MRNLILASSVLALMTPLAVTPAAAQGNGMAQSTQTDPGQFLVFFDFDSASLRPDAAQVVARAADEYRQTGQARVTLLGNADRTGSPDYNLRLSQRRADTVANELVRQGVPASAIDIDAAGESAPLVQTGDGVREPRNRYVSIVFPVEQPAPAPVAEAPPPEPEPMPEPATRPQFAVTLGGLYGYNFREKDSANDLESQSAGPEIGLHYEPSPYVTLSLEQGALYAYDSDDQGWAGRTVVGVDVQGDFAGVHPYVGANLGGVYGKGTQDGVVVGPEIGIRGDVSERTFLYAKAAYDVNLRNNIDDGIIWGGAGVGFRF